MFQPMFPGVPAIDPTELDPAAPVPAGTLLLDVREQDEWDSAHVPGSVHIPLGDLPARYGELDPDLQVLVICHSGARSARATQWLAETAGFDTVNIDGGIVAWARAGLPVEA